MKIHCHCGHAIVAGADDSPTRARWIPERRWNALWDAIDEAVERTPAEAKAREAACMRLRQRGDARAMYLCSSCGRLWLDDANGELHCFEPREGESDGARDLLSR